jgi:hypothetical protein
MSKQVSELKRWCAILAEGNRVPDTVPEGWFTLKQIAKARKRSPCTVGDTIRRLMAEGKAQKKLFRLRLKERTRPVAHYKLK